jgi:ubiquinone/menaquinone biosynthesis C-methylase UbiE
VNPADNLKKAQPEMTGDRTDNATNEQYTLGYGEGAMQWMTSRTAEGYGAFFLPYLEPGMRFMDCGCGPGTLTLGFARQVAPGAAIGVDRQIAQTAPTAEAAQREALTTLRFEAGDIYSLDYPDEFFDAVFGSAVLGSVAHPERVVKEMLRVLKPGGIIGLKEFDHGGDIIYPQTQVIERSIELYHRLRAENGHEPYAGRRLKAYLSAHGCRVDYVRALYDQASDSKALEAYVERNNQLFIDILGPQYEALGWCTAAELDESIQEWRVFAQDPAAVYLACWLEAVGIKDSSA